MRQLLIVGLLGLAGCQGVVGPVQRALTPTPPIDAPCLTIAEQEQRERQFLALPSSSPEVGPRTYSGNPNLRQ